MRHLHALALIAATLLATAGPVPAQDHGHDAHATPYAGHLDREIKALAPREQAGLEQGHGLGLALAAELNGYPGPKHVLELADELALTASQRAAVQASYDTMSARARALGTEIVALERRLDQAFATRTVTRESIERLVGTIGERRARLRAVHLAAHLEMMDVLSAEQRKGYARARGYGG